ncbi:MAG: hypothetical protein RIC12_00075 [Pirellulales bacterium]
MTNHMHENGTVFEATICDQFVKRNWDDELQVVFTVKITGKLSEDGDETDRVEPVKAFERDVYITLSKDVQKLRIALDHLEKLGFADSDISKLHPDHAQFLSLIDKAVLVRCRVKGDKTYWNFAWPRQPAKPVALGETQTAAADLQKRIETLQSKSQAGGVPNRSTTDETSQAAFKGAK